MSCLTGLPKLTTRTLKNRLLKTAHGQHITHIPWVFLLNSLRRESLEIKIKQTYPAEKTASEGSI